MGSHPFNLFLRFLLELIALATVGLWGWKQSDNWLRFVLAITIPLILAIIWGTFAVPNDPSRSGSAPIATPGFIRFLIELGFFGFAIWALKDINWIMLSLVMCSLVIIHYIASYDRVKWLFNN